MALLIINRFSPKRVNYSQIQKEYSGEILFLTKSKFENYFKKEFTNVFTFDNDDLYYSINKIFENYSIDLILSTYEFDIEYVGKLRDQMGIIGQNEISSRSFRDKFFMKQQLRGIVNIPNFEKVDDAIDLINFTKKEDYPLVIKPRDGAGSVDVEILNNEADLLSYLRNGVNKNLIVEKFVPGEMCHVDGIYHNGELKICQPSIYINGCLNYKEETYVGSVMLTSNNPLSEQLKTQVKLVLDNLPTPNHAIAFHAEFFVNGDKITFCEIASRVGGGMISEALYYAYNGFDILEDSMLAQCQITTARKITRNSKNYGWVLIPPQIGTLHSIPFSTPFEWVKEVYIREEDIGATFEKANSSVDAVASIVVEGTTEQDIRDKIEQVVSWYSKNIIWNNSEVNE